MSTFFIILILVFVIAFMFIRRLRSILWIHLRYDGRIFVVRRQTFEDEWITYEQLRTELQTMKKKGRGMIYFSRDNPDQDPSSEVSELIDFIVSYKLPMKQVSEAPPRIQMLNDPFKKAISGSIPPLMRAVMEKKPEGVRELLSQGVDMNITFHSPKLRFHKIPILAVAALNGDVSTVQILLEYGADINGVDADGATPLMFAASFGHNAIVSLLLEKSAKLEKKNNFGNTALSGAVFYQEINCAKTLLSHGANPNVVYKPTNSLNDGDFQSLLSIAAFRNDQSMVEILLDAGADINSRDKNGLSALHLASLNDQSPILEELIKRGANIEIKDKYGCTPLMVAANSGKINNVETLLLHGANVHATDEEDATAITAAAQYGYNEIVSLLLKYGADPHKKCKLGLSAIGIAQQTGLKDTVELMEKV